MITSVTFALNGQTVTLTGSDGVYTGTLTAPASTSYFDPDSKIVGTCLAEAVDALGNATSAEATAGVRVIETGKPSISVQELTDWCFDISGVPVFRWLVRDEGSGIDPGTVSLTIDGAAVSGITYADGVCSWSGPVAEGSHTAAFDVSDNDGNAAETVSVIFGVFRLITDRTPPDAEWESGVDKGAYTAGDLNRVGWATYFVTNLAALSGYGITTEARHDWTDQDASTRTQMGTYLADAQAVHALPHIETATLPAAISRLTTAGANAIEKNLADAQRALLMAKQSYVYSGEAVAGAD